MTDRRDSAGGLAAVLALIVPCLVALASASSPSRAVAQGSTWQTVARANMVVDEIAVRNQKGLPPKILRGAYAVAIMPEIVKGGFVFGGRYGKGVLLIRTPSGWSNPVFVSFGGGSFGAQIGFQITDLVLVFKNRASLDGFLRGRGKVTFGVNASVAGGPVGVHSEAATDARLQSEILAFSRNRGLFAGASVDGASLSIDDGANAQFYGRYLDPNTILTSPDLVIPEPALQLRETLALRAGISAERKAPRGDSAVTIVRPAPGVIESAPVVEESITGTTVVSPLDEDIVPAAPAPAPRSRPGTRPAPNLDDLPPAPSLDDPLPPPAESTAPRRRPASPPGGGSIDLHTLPPPNLDAPATMRPATGTARPKPSRPG
jgi:lipid-binding SYLF domain-containing protein